MRRAGLSLRLIVAIAVVLVAAGVTTWLVAGLVGPGAFHDHLVEGGARTGEEAVAHAELAFEEASGRALAVGMLMGAVAALAMSLLIARRLGASLAHLARAAHDIAGGSLEARVPDPRMGGEFEELAAAFNQMAVRLEASEQLRQRLLSDVAHELRTPVATMNAYLESLEDGVEELSPEVVAMLRGEGARLARLSDDLAAVTQAESGAVSLDREPHAASGLIADAVARARQRYAEAGVVLEGAADADLPRVNVDGERLAQVLGNLLDNALRHTPAGGRVTVHARRSGRGIAIAVADTGVGIDAAHLPFVFERFYRVDEARDRARGGSGVGLAIVKALVEAHGGAVEAASPGVGHGATFTVTLPPAP